MENKEKEYKEIVDGLVNECKDLIVDAHVKAMLISPLKNARQNVINIVSEVHSNNLLEQPDFDPSAKFKEIKEALNEGYKYLKSHTKDRDHGTPTQALHYACTTWLSQCLSIGTRIAGYLDDTNKFYNPELAKLVTKTFDHSDIIPKMRDAEMVVSNLDDEGYALMLIPTIERLENAANKAKDKDFRNQICAYAYGLLLGTLVTPGRNSLSVMNDLEVIANSLNPEGEKDPVQPGDED